MWWTIMEEWEWCHPITLTSQNSGLDLALNMQAGLMTGTYKIVFTLYDGQTKISEMDKTIIIK